MKNKYTIMIVSLFLFANMLFAKETVGLLDENLPADFPPIVMSDVDNPAPGYYFLGNNSGKGGGSTYANYIMILDLDGKPQAYRKIGTGARLPRSFQQVSCGLMTFTEESTSGQLGFICDENLNKIDSLPGYNTGRVDIMPNGHYLLTEKENIPMDLSLVFKGGDPNATLAGNKVYELDANKNIVFLWRTTDYYPLNMSYSDSLGAKYDFCHTNMIFPDYDGNFLLSQRNFSSITKVNKRTGEIIWKLGGKQNEFTFIGENEANAPNYFSYQHHVRRLPNGNITMFDNGVQHDPQAYSRGVEYKIDEVNKTATMVWEYRQTPDVAAKAEGSVETLPNGNKVIGWGEASSTSGPALTELHPDNTIATQITLPKGYKSMMAAKFPWKSNVPVASFAKDVVEGNSYDFNQDEQNTCLKVKVLSLIPSGNPNISVKKYNFAPMYPKFYGTTTPMVAAKRIVIETTGIDSLYAEYRINAACMELNYKPEEYYVYARELPGEGVFKQIPTVYHPITGDLIITTSMSGEFIVGIPEPETKPNIPVLVTPKDLEKTNQTRPVSFTWSPHGYFTDTRLMVATDNEFNNIVVDTLVKGIKLNYSKFKSDQTYYWKIKSINGTTEGDFSEIRSFNTTAPFLLLKVPNGGEVWEKNTIKYIIRWDKNISDLVKIELFKNDVSVAVIKDSLNCPTGAFGWKIPAEIVADSIYKIRVTNVSNAAMYEESDNVFTIDEKTSVNELLQSKYQLDVSPNPATNKITISLNNEMQPFGQDISISIYDTRGIEIKRFTSSDISAQSSLNYSIEGLPSGVYYCTLNIGANSITKSFVVVR